VPVIPITALDKWLPQAGIMSASHTFYASLEAEAAVPQNAILGRTLHNWRLREGGTLRLGSQPETVTAYRTEGGIAVLCEGKGSAHVRR
jgi:hypothetical protein